MNESSEKIIWTHDKRLALQFRTRKDAAQAAKLLGFPAKSPLRIEIMGFYIWALADDHVRFLTKIGEAHLRAEREEYAESIRQRAIACQ